METTDKVIIQNKATSIFIGWKELPFEWRFAILWRGIYLTININAHRTEYGQTQTVVFSYKGVDYLCKLTKWKWSGGGNGIYPPHIETESYSLKIRIILNALELTDVPKIISDVPGFQSNPFIMFYQS